jgi:3',5'-cyclic-nucleotide phosphodiesterase
VRLFVAGCHGGETPKHRTSAFVLDGALAIDAGALTSGLDLRAQCRLKAVLVSHAHLDHVRDLATIADNRTQCGMPPLLVCGTKFTLGVLKKHFFNDLVWPDFSVIPTAAAPAIRYVPLVPERPIDVVGYTVRAIEVSHTIETCAFIVQRGKKSIIYSGDTGPTDRLWEAAAELPSLDALLMEVSFPDEQQRLATISGHHTPKTLGEELRKLRAPKDVPTLLYHIKPVFQAKVERECARIKGVNLTVLDLGDEYLV